MKTEIGNAISKQLLIELRYSGLARIVEPYAYGRDFSGDEILRCFQVSGGSISGERVGWKLFKISDAYSIHMTEETFSVRKEYRRNDKAMDRIFAQI